MPRPYLTHVRLVTSADNVETRTLAAEFPTVKVERAHAAQVAGAIIGADAWRSLSSFQPFDEAISRAGSNRIIIHGDRQVEHIACEVLTRYQRLLSRRNGGSRMPMFSAVLRAHLALHDQAKPLVKADLDHALDTWQWMLRLEPTASLTAQLAALFHDIERLESEADVRVEHKAPDYQAFKDAHAARGGVFTFEVLRAAGVPETIAARVREIVTLHERRGQDPEVDLLNDADALSFLSLNSSGYLDYFGPEQTRLKIAYTLGRLGDSAKTKLGLVRLRPDVRFLAQAAA